MAAPNQTLTCGPCGYANEPERVYCHNCGTKLDRSLLPKEDGRKQESVEKTRRRVRKMTNPGQDSPVVREVKAFFKTIIWAAVVAALILFALPPDGIPEKSLQLCQRGSSRANSPTRWSRLSPDHCSSARRR
jgi:hypothetical protein